MDAIDRLIATLVRLVVSWIPGHTLPRVAGDPPVTPAAEHRAAEVAEDVPEPDFRTRLTSAFQRAPAAYQRARNLAYRDGVEEAGGQQTGNHYRDQAELTDWWQAELDKLLALLDTKGIDQAVVAARAQRLFEREASTQLSTAHGEGVRDEADRRGLHRILIPERDACLRCTSYAGAIAAPGESFRMVRNFTDDEDDPADGVEVPVHPWCRCTTRAVALDDAHAAARPLRREAERSVLRFEALPSESDRERKNAADRLLNAGTQLAKTVEERSARAIRAFRKQDPIARPKSPKGP